MNRQQGFILLMFISGDKGGTVVACGTPEEVAENEKSYTGKYIDAILKKK